MPKYHLPQFAAGAAQRLRNCANWNEKEAERAKGNRDVQRAERLSAQAQRLREQASELDRA